jgi:putative ABC transport system permease protein
VIKNYLKVAFRSLLKNRNTLIINILGLGIAIFASILIFLYVNFEFSYDSFHSNSDRIYRVVLEDNNLGVSENEAGITFIALGPELKSRLPEVEEQIRIYKSGRELLTLNETESYYTEDLAYTTSELFDVFDFPLIQGDKETVLSRPRTAVLNKTWKEKLFGNQNPIGKPIFLRKRRYREIFSCGNRQLQLFGELHIYFQLKML